MATQVAKKPTITATPMQQEAIDSIEQWYKNSENQTFFLAGYAGTGKSTIVDLAIENTGLKHTQVAYACYTGKAALVLTQKSKGKFKAQTIHRLIYKLEGDGKGAPKFVRKPKSELSHLKLITIDEWSMVDGKTLEDLKYYGIKLLLIGDQGQLPPISQSNNVELQHLLNNPDYTLTEIHRQAADNPIIYLSMLARTKQEIPYGWHGKDNEVLVVNRMQWESIKEKVYGTADQIICGYNKTRQGMNQDIRRYLGFTEILPQEGDKLICTKNNWSKSIRDVSLVNGMTGFVKKINHDVKKDYEIKRDSMELQFRPDFTDESFEKLYLVQDHFKGVNYKLAPHEYSIYSEFDYGYAITCHKSQGSQWDKVVVISEVLDRENHHRWLYTAITRSAERLVLVI